jgi:hypothetical protein
MKKKVVLTEDQFDDDDLHNREEFQTALELEEQKAQEMALLSKNVSLLDTNAIRWMNKRKPRISQSVVTHIPPARALELRSIFKGLDFDNSGTLEIDELKQAVEYVAAADKSGDPVFKDPKKIISFFRSMDADGNGNVDFNEFLNGMTSTADPSSEGANASEKLQDAFFSFANKHRRQKILDNVQVVDNRDVEKYKMFMTLFSINYFKDEHYNESVAEKIDRLKREAKRDAAVINSEGHQKARKREFSRSREAAMLFEQEKSQYISADRYARANATLGALEQSHIADAHFIASKIDRQIRRNASLTNLRNQKTFVPNSLGTTSMKTMRLFAINEAQSAKLNRTSSFSSIPILPPVPTASRTVSMLKKKS